MLMQNNFAVENISRFVKQDRKHKFMMI